MNIVILRGTLTRETSETLLPSGDRLLRYSVTTRPEEGPAESVPVSWLKPPARVRALPAETEVVVLGRVRRRFFQTGGGTMSRTEVTAEAVVAATQRTKVLGLIDHVVAALTDDPS